MAYRIVEQAKNLPQKCAMLPQLGSEHRKGYFDANARSTGVDPWMYVSVQFVEEAAEQLGWLSPEKHEEMCQNAVIDGERILELEEEIVEANRELDAINVIRSKGWKPQRKSGPKRKTPEEAA